MALPLMMISQVSTNVLGIARSGEPFTVCSSIDPANFANDNPRPVLLPKSDCLTTPIGSTKRDAHQTIGQHGDGAYWVTRDSQEHNTQFSGCLSLIDKRCQGQ